MPLDVFETLDQLDTRRSQRARELSELKLRGNNDEPDPFDLNSKSVIVLSYAHWEGFYNDCISIYVEYLKQLKLKTTQAYWLMLLGNLEADFARLRDRNHSYEAKCNFVEDLQNRLETEFDGFDSKCLQARSNLNFEKLKLNFRILGFDIDPMMKYRNRLDKELVAWRHSVAHGNSPELETFAIARHIDLTSNLLLALSDAFQAKMLDLSPGA